ncbi:MAG TPA: PIN domain-containing protein [Gemmatimonadales bacterium]|nr:PIN domain-containing protein [Gemmatimonadales bacterium]
MFLLDTDVLIDVQRRHPPALQWFTGLKEPPSVPGFVAMELIQDAANAQQVQAALKLIAPLPLVWPRQADCARALTDFSKLHLSHGLGLIDALIAATAVGRGALLCTFNVKHYQAVPSLILFAPYRK